MMKERMIHHPIQAEVAYIKYVFERAEKWVVNIVKCAIYLFRLHIRR